MKKVILFLLVVAHFALAAASNYFEAFAEPFPINDAAIFNNRLFLATEGGIRLVDKFGASFVFNSSHGLGATAFASVVATDEALYGISAKGIICRFPKEGKATEINRSFENDGAVALNGLAAAAGKYIVIAFDKKIAFFDTESEAFLISLSKIDDVSLDAHSPTALLVSHDSLFIAIDGNVFLRKMDWSGLGKDRHLADPTSWKKVKTGKRIRSMTIVNGELKTRDLAGTYFFKDGKQFSASEDTSRIVIGGKKVLLNDLYSEGLSRVKYIFEVGKEYFFVGSRFIGFGNGENVVDITSYDAYELGGTYEAVSLPQGGILVASLKGTISYGNGIGFSHPFFSNEYGWKNGEGGYSFPIKALSVLPSGEVLYSVWGLGLFVYSDVNFSKTNFSILAQDGTCIENFLENYVVIPSATPAPDGSGFLFTYWGSNGYGLGYVDLFGDVYCAARAGNFAVSGTMIARAINGSEFEVFVSGNVAQAVNANGFVDRFIVRPPRLGGDLIVQEKTTLQTPDNGFPIDMAFAPDSALWLTTYSKIGYWKSGDSVQAPHRISQFSGSSYSSIAVDPHGNLWVGSTLDGLYHLSRKKNSNDTLSAVNYRARDGLLCDNIYDLALDSTTGTLWMTQNEGMTRLIRNDLRNSKSFMTDSAEFKVKVFPNPFRPKRHSKIVFDYVAENARISVYNAGGKLVASFANEDLVGGRVEWDGRDGSGNLVAPGVYTYVILQKGKSEKQGRLIIAH